MDAVIQQLSNSSEPSIRYRMSVDVFGKPKDSLEVKGIQEKVRNSIRVKTMLAARNSDGEFPWHAYQKWKGAFWTLLVLADLGYPSGDQTLFPLREQINDWLFNPKRLKAIPLIKGKYRRCALQEGGTVFSLIQLGLTDLRVDQLIELLLKWQWPDGGWNCDKKPNASHSSFYETWLPLRAMNAYYNYSGDVRAKAAMERAADIFLSRKLYKGLASGEVILKNFTQLAYPVYWHYDILVALKVMCEIGKIDDPRCKDALDLLETKYLPAEGFPAEAKYYKVTEKEISGVSSVQWGPVSAKKMNEFVTVEALTVLKKAGRL
ncbi:MAG: hypothetical protein FD147_1495 [Chloroflexi bacterium]|nr:MAG: hypothetical protein FD147_1495 [Chloroflexota bacterium]